MKAVLAGMMFGAIAAAFLALATGLIWGFMSGHWWLGVLCALVIGGWYWLSMGKRDPDNPNDYKDFGV